MSKHTAGEWTRDGNYIRTENADGEEVTICQIGNVDSVHFPPPDDEVEANTRLIIAAPKLLKMLEELRDVMHLQPKPGLGGWDWHGMTDRAEELIKKARGRE